MNTSAHRAYIGLGANLGDSRATLEAALRALATLPDCQLECHSSLYCSAPVDAEGAHYTNAVACLRTSLTPHALLEVLHAIEMRFGRTRPFRNAPRTLDLDLLLFDTERLDSPTLQIPHPRILERAFVLYPLLELAPDLHIPGHGPAAAFLERVGQQEIHRLQT